MNEENKKIVVDLLTNLTCGRLEAALDALAEDATWWVPPMTQPLSKRQFADMVTQAQKVHPHGITLIRKGVTAENDRVAVEAEGEADLANGKHYHNHYHHLFVVRDGKIREAREYLDTKHVAEVLGDDAPSNIVENTRIGSRGA